MNIAGIQKITLIDYPGKPAATIFTRGCSFCCPFCHNPELVIPERFNDLIDEEEILSFLEKRKGKLEAVCITGGEPTINSDLPEFIGKIKKLGFLVKLDTNGSNPVMLEKILNEKLVDYVAMDIKSPFEKYQKVSGSNIDIEKIKKSISLIINSGIDHEFRTTFVKPLHSAEDFAKIGEMILGAQRYFIQNFADGKRIDESADFSSFTVEELFEGKKEIERFVREVKIRGN